MKTLPSKVTHISSNTEFKPISMNMGGKIKMKQTNKGGLTTKKGSIHEIDYSDIYEGHLYVTPIGENFHLKS